MRVCGPATEFKPSLAPTRDGLESDVCSEGHEQLNFSSRTTPLFHSLLRGFRRAEVDPSFFQRQLLTTMSVIPPSALHRQLGMSTTGLLRGGATCSPIEEHPGSPRPAFDDGRSAPAWRGWGYSSPGFRAGHSARRAVLRNRRAGLRLICSADERQGQPTGLAAQKVRRSGDSRQWNQGISSTEPRAVAA